MNCFWIKQNLAGLIDLLLKMAFISWQRRKHFRKITFFRYFLFYLFMPRLIFINLSHSTMLSLDVIYGRHFFLFDVLPQLAFFPINVISGRCFFLFNILLPSTFFLFDLQSYSVFFLYYIVSNSALIIWTFCPSMFFYLRSFI